MKISVLKVRKTIHRPTREFDVSGKRLYHAFEYDLPYKASYEGNERERLFAKIMDMIPFFLVFLWVFHHHALFALLCSIPSVIILGTLTETLWGTTFGKKIFKIKVIDDDGKYPKFLKSIMRNLLGLVNFLPDFADAILTADTRSKCPTADSSMHLNNHVCKTYIIKEHQYREIKELLKVSHNGS